MQILYKLHEKYPNDIFVFQSRKSQNQKNKPASSISRQVVTKAFKTASYYSSVAMTPNSIRHYYATQLFLMSAVEKSDPQWLSRHLGHESKSMTKHYVSNCHNKENESLNCLSAPKADMTNREPEMIEYLLNGGTLINKN